MLKQTVWSSLTLIWLCKQILLISNLEQLAKKIPEDISDTIWYKRIEVNAIPIKDNRYLNLNELIICFSIGKYWEYLEESDWNDKK